MCNNHFPVEGHQTDPIEALRAKEREHQKKVKAAAKLALEKGAARRARIAEQQRVGVHQEVEDGGARDVEFQSLGCGDAACRRDTGAPEIGNGSCAGKPEAEAVLNK